jgi:integration host factor subunit alpha
MPKKIEILEIPLFSCYFNEQSMLIASSQKQTQEIKSMNITKASLMKSVCNNSNLPKRESISTVEALLETIKRTLASGEDLLISGFGKFCVKDKKERMGRNPQTGDDMMVDARRVVRFKCSNVMRDKINGKG